MFIGSIVAVIITITDPDPADTATVAAGELVAMASPVGMSTDARRFITSIPTIVLAVAVPPCRDTPVSRLTAEIICSPTHAYTNKNNNAYRPSCRTRKRTLHVHSPG